MKKRHILAYLGGTIGNYFGATLLTSYALLFMTDYIGMNAGIVGVLMAVSKVFDGISDVIAGTIIDNTRSKLGRARSWILRMILPLILVEVLFFSVPSSWGDAAIYVYFFIMYTVFNAVVYTLYTLSMSTLPVYTTRNDGELVSLSICNFAGNTIAGTVISATYLTFVEMFGGDAAGWRKTAYIFLAIFAVLSLLCVAVMKELPIEEDSQNKQKEGSLKLVFRNIRYLATNRYFVFQLIIMILYMAGTAMFMSGLPYYAIYVLKNTAIQGTFSLTSAGVIIGLVFAPLTIKKLGIYRSNLYTRILSLFLYLGVIIGAVKGNVTLMLISNLLFMISCGPFLGSINSLAAEIAGYTWRKEKVHIEATVVSTSTMGNKIGNALGVAVVGWLLASVHYDGTLSVQPIATQNMITFIFVFVPFIVYILITLVLAFHDPVKANRLWDQQHPEQAAQIAEESVQGN